MKLSGLDLVVGLPLAPLLLAQGVIAGRRAGRLPEAAGPRAGTAGHGPPLRLLIVGDSSAAGVGAPDQSSALAGRLVAGLALQRQVTWELVGRTGFTTKDVLAALESRPLRPPLDVAVTALGINDITHGSTLRGWLHRQVALVDFLQNRCETRLVLLSGLPPLGRFPLLPWPLRWVLGARARKFEAARCAWVAQRPGCEIVPLNFDDLGPGAMAADGFHPGPEIYARWGARLTAKILENDRSSG